MESFVQLAESVDPAAASGSVRVYAKDTAGVAQLFARSDDGTITQLTPLGGGGLTPAQHASLRQLIHFIDDGPADGFASGAVKTTAYSGALVVGEVWWEDATLTQRIVDLAVTYAGALPAVEVWRMYDTDGVTVLVTLTDTITYAGALEVTRTRVWV